MGLKKICSACLHLCMNLTACVCFGDVSRCGQYTDKDGMLQDEMAAMELRLQIAVSTRDQLAELLQTSTRQLEAAQQAQDATIAQLQTAQVQQ